MLVASMPESSEKARLASMLSLTRWGMPMALAGVSSTFFRSAMIDVDQLGGSVLHGSVLDLQNEWWLGKRNCSIVISFLSTSESQLGPVFRENMNIHSYAKDYKKNNNKNKIFTIYSLNMALFMDFTEIIKEIKHINIGDNTFIGRASEQRWKIPLNVQQKVLQGIKS